MAHKAIELMGNKAAVRVPEDSKNVLEVLAQMYGLNARPLFDLEVEDPLLLYVIDSHTPVYMDERYNFYSERLGLFVEPFEEEIELEYPCDARLCSKRPQATFVQPTEIVIPPGVAELIDAEEGKLLNVFHNVDVLQLGYKGVEDAWQDGPAHIFHGPFVYAENEYLKYDADLTQLLREAGFVVDLPILTALNK